MAGSTMRSSIRKSPTIPFIELIMKYLLEIRDEALPGDMYFFERKLSENEQCLFCFGGAYRQKAACDPGQLGPCVDQVIDGLHPAQGCIQVDQLDIAVIE